MPADDSDATRPTWSRAPRRASEGRKKQVFGGFAGCGGRWVAQTAPKHVLEPPRSRCTALGGGRRSHAAPAAAARFCRFSRYGRSSRVPSHKIRCRGFPLTKQKCGISLSRPPRPCDQKGSHSLLAKRTSVGANTTTSLGHRGYFWKFCPKAARGLLGGWGTPPRLGARIWFAWICPKKATCSCEFCSQSAKRADAKRPLPHQFRQTNWSALDIWFILSEQRWCGKLCPGLKSPQTFKYQYSTLIHENKLIGWLVGWSGRTPTASRRCSKGTGWFSRLV